MAELCFVDSNIVLYCHDLKELTRREQATRLLERLLTERNLVVSAQVLNEVYSNLISKLRVAPADAAAIIGLLCARPVVPLTSETTQRAIQRSSKDAVSFWDALILEAALEAGCTTLYSEDFQHGRRYGKLTVKNPFA